MKRLRRWIQFVLDFYSRPEVWMGCAIWAPPMVIPASSPIWRVALMESRPKIELASETVTAPQPARDPAAVARRRASLRLVTSLQEVRP